MWLCQCACHNEAVGNYREAVQYERWFDALTFSNSPIINLRVPVDARDPIEAAVAEGCDCRGNHAIALTVKGPLDFYGTPWTPEKDRAERQEEES